MSRLCVRRAYRTRVVSMISVHCRSDVRQEVGDRDQRERADDEDGGAPDREAEPERRSLCSRGLENITDSRPSAASSSRSPCRSCRAAEDEHVDHVRADQRVVPDVRQNHRLRRPARRCASDMSGTSRGRRAISRPSRVTRGDGSITRSPTRRRVASAAPLERRMSA